MTETPTSPDRKRRLFCNECKSETNHVLRGEHQRKDFEENEYGELVHWEETNSRLWICSGCDTGTLEVAWTCQGNQDHQGEQLYISEYHPRRNAQDLSLKRFRQLPEALGDLYLETIQAFNSGLYLLCAGGLRALLEGICQDKEIKGQNLEKKIDGLDSMLPTNIVQHLHGFRFMGNEALHNLAAPEPDEVRIAIEVMEDLLNFIYELDYKASRLMQKKAVHTETITDHEEGGGSCSAASGS